MAFVLERLAEMYGTPTWQPRRDGTSELVLTILSQHTSDLNAERAFDELRRRFPTWDAVEAADPADLAAAIRSGGLAVQKAPRIREALAAIREARGDYDLDFLASWPALEARDWLTRIPGIGPKTASVVLLFCYGLPLMPIDTHVERVSRRIGLIRPAVDVTRAHDDVLRDIPAERDLRGARQPHHPRAPHVPRPQPGLRPVPRRAALPLRRSAGCLRRTAARDSGGCDEPRRHRRKAGVVTGAAQELDAQRQAVPVSGKRQGDGRQPGQHARHAHAGVAGRPQAQRRDADRDREPAARRPAPGLPPGAPCTHGGSVALAASSVAGVARPSLMRSARRGG